MSWGLRWAYWSIRRWTSRTDVSETGLVGQTVLMGTIVSVVDMAEANAVSVMVGAEAINVVETVSAVGEGVTGVLGDAGFAGKVTLRP